MIDLSTKRILVTGGAGFLGSYVVKALSSRGCKNLFVPRSRHYNLTDASSVRFLFATARPQVVFHLAASCGGIGANRENPGRFLYENAMMGLNVIEAARNHGVEKVVLVGSVCSYPKHAPPPFCEDDLWSGYPEETNAPYGIAKRLLLAQAQAYRQQYGMNAIMLMPANLYGPRDNFNLDTSHVIPAMIRKFEEARRTGVPVTLWGNGTPTREFLYVEDCAEGLVLAAERYDGAEPVNLGNGREVSVAGLAGMIAEIVGYEGEILWDASQPNGQPCRCLDVNRARAFGFEARVGLEDGLRRTVEWWREHEKRGENDVK